MEAAIVVVAAVVALVVVVVVVAGVVVVVVVAVVVVAVVAAAAAAALGMTDPDSKNRCILAWNRQSIHRNALESLQGDHLQDGMDLEGQMVDTRDCRFVTHSHREQDNILVPPASLASFHEDVALLAAPWPLPLRLERLHHDLRVIAQLLAHPH